MEEMSENMIQIGAVATHRDRWQEIVDFWDRHCIGEVPDFVFPVAPLVATESNFAIGGCLPLIAEMVATIRDALDPWVEVRADVPLQGTRCRVPLDERTVDAIATGPFEDDDECSLYVADDGDRIWLYGGCDETVLVRRSSLTEEKPKPKLVRLGDVSEQSVPPNERGPTVRREDGTVRVIVGWYFDTIVCDPKTRALEEWPDDTLVEVIEETS